MGTMKNSVDQLNSFLRGEISAVETYNQAMTKLRTMPYASQLEDCKRSHEQRVQLLKDQIRRLGGTPVDASGPWGAFAKLVEGGAATVGEKVAIAALEEGEDHGLRDYRNDIAKLDPEVRTFVEQRILPEQQRTHAGVSTLKKQLH
jgi:hypothetical protein